MSRDLRLPCGTARLSNDPGLVENRRLGFPIRADYGLLSSLVYAFFSIFWGWAWCSGGRGFECGRGVIVGPRGPRIV